MIALALRIARRDLRGSLGGFRVFLACLALGVAAIAAVGTVRGALEDGLRREGARLLGGDVQIEITYRFASDAEKAFMETLGRVTQVVDFRSLAVAGDQRGLTQVKGVDSAYPLIGAVELSPSMPLATALDGEDGLPGTVMDPALLARLGAKVGDEVMLGTQKFVVMASLTRTPDGVGGFTLGPPTIVRSGDLTGSGLLAPGTLFETEYRVVLRPGLTVEDAHQQALTNIEGGAFRWSDAREGAPGTQRFIDRLSAFLVLTGLAGLATGGVGIATAVRSYLSEKRGTIATLKVLGASRGLVFGVYVIQIAALAALGILLGLVLGAVLPFAAIPLVEAQLPLPVGSLFQPVALAEAALYGALAAGLFTLWPLAQSEHVRAAALYRDAALGRGAVPRGRWIALMLVLLAALVGAAAALTGAAQITLYAAGGLIGAFVALVLLAGALRWMARRAQGAMTGRTTLRLALGAIGGPGSDTGAVVLSLGLGLTVLAAVGQIDANLRGAIDRDLPKIAPSFFAVDIQPDQVDAFEKAARSDPDVTDVETAPMLRGIITRINGSPASEVGGDHWVLRGDRGVTFSDRPPTGTTITAGTWWPENYDGPPQISFAAEEAAEIGLKLGDVLTVNILGRDIPATVTSFRQVKFETAGIGFVMLMDPAAVRGAPHSSIATIYGKPEADIRLMRGLSTEFPNITLIRVRDAIARASEILASIATAVTFGALATLATGTIVLIGAAAAGERARVYEAAVLKTLGAARGAILLNFALRGILLGTVAGALAVLGGGVAGWAVSRFVMQTAFHFEPASALLIVVGGVVVTLLTGMAFALRPLSTPPARVLRAKE